MHPGALSKSGDFSQHLLQPYAQPPGKELLAGLGEKVTYKQHSWPGKRAPEMLL